MPFSGEENECLSLPFKKDRRIAPKIIEILEAMSQIWALTALSSTGLEFKIELVGNEMGKEIGLSGK